MTYQVLAADNITVITDTDTGLRVQVNEKDKLVMPINSAYCQATLYRADRSFIPEKIYVFRALAATELDLLKTVVDFFFTTLMDTELYVKEIPRDSAFFPEEALRLYGEYKADSPDAAMSFVSNGA